MVGALRIVQANCNKRSSGFLGTTALFLRYGAFFEGMAALFSLLYLFLFGFDGFGGATVLCSLLSAVCYVTELITALAALKTAPLVLCNMCSMGGGIILTSVAGILLFDEGMTPLQWLGVLLFFAAAWCLTPGQTDEKTSAPNRMTAKSWLLLTANFLINGAAGTLGKYFAVRVENGNAARYSCFTYAISSLLFLTLVALYAVARRSAPVSVFQMKPVAEAAAASQPAAQLQPTAEAAAASQPAPQMQPAPQKFPRPLFRYGAVMGAACASIVYLTTTLSRTVTVVVLNTVPSAISIIGCLLVGAALFRERITAKNLCGVGLGILSVALIVWR